MGEVPGDQRDRWVRREKIAWIGLAGAASLVLLARGWLTLRWESPVRDLLWNESLLSPVVGLFGATWEDYAASSDAGITLGLQIAGWLLIASAPLPWLVGHRRWAAWLLAPAVFLLGVDAVARFAGGNFELGSALEYALQWGAPLLVVIACAPKRANRVNRANLASRPVEDAFANGWQHRPSTLPTVGNRWIALGMVCCAATFVGHGLYAIGFHSVPWHFQAMTGDLLGLGETGCLRFLFVVGVLDLVAAAVLLVPSWRRTGLCYMVGWGAATALARPLSHGGTLDPWVVEALVRTPHWLVPLVLLWVISEMLRSTGAASGNACLPSH